MRFLVRICFGVYLGGRGYGLIFCEILEIELFKLFFLEGFVVDGGLGGSELVGVIVIG